MGTAEDEAEGRVPVPSFPSLPSFFPRLSPALESGWGVPLRFSTNCCPSLFVGFFRFGGA